MFATAPLMMRLMTPDDVVLQKKAADVFRYENRDIAYSSKRTVEYGGEDLPVTMYWTVGEVLQAGTYRADIFADGHLIGTQTFTLGK